MSGTKCPVKYFSGLRVYIADMTFLPTTSHPVAVLCTFLSIAFNEEAQKTSLLYMDNIRYNVSPDTKHMVRGCSECDIEKLVQKFEKKHSYEGDAIM